MGIPLPSQAEIIQGEKNKIVVVGEEHRAKQGAIRNMQSLLNR